MSLRQSMHEEKLCHGGQLPNIHVGKSQVTSVNHAKLRREVSSGITSSASSMSLRDSFITISHHHHNSSPFIIQNGNLVSCRVRCLPQGLTHELGPATASPTPSKRLINRTKIEYSKAEGGCPGRDGGREWRTGHFIPSPRRLNLLLHSYHIQ